jgi:hypothetical protein
LLADRNAQQALTLSQRVLDTLAIEVPAKDEEDHTSGEVPKLYGRSHLLQELAAKAYADGHLPVLISEKRGKEPKTADDLLAKINLQTQVVLSRLNLNAVRLRVLDWLFTLGKGPAIDVPAFVPEGIAYDVKNLKADAEVPLPVKAKALCHDFGQVLEQVRQQCRPVADGPHTRLVLLIDDLHRIEGGAVGDILSELVGGLGLTSIAEDVRIVLAWASVAKTGQETAVKSIEDFLKGLPTEAKITIERFGRRYGASPAEDEPEIVSVEERLAYEFFLLRKQQMSVRPQALQPLIKMFWQTCSKVSDGIPSRLEIGVKSALEIAKKSDALDALFHQVDDETRLQSAKGRTR